MLQKKYANLCLRYLPLGFFIFVAIMLMGCDQPSIDDSAASDPAPLVDSGPNPDTDRFHPGPRPTPTPTPRPTPTPTPSPGGVNNYALQVLSLVNQARAANGIQPLSLNPLLTDAAQSYAAVMASINVLNHTGPDGSSPGNRISAAGYRWSTWGENIAMGYPTPDAVMNGWLGSAGHRANILNPNFREIGIGVKASSTGYQSLYWVQDFGSP